MNPKPEPWWPLTAREGTEKDAIAHIFMPNGDLLVVFQPHREVRNTDDDMWRVYLAETATERSITKTWARIGTFEDLVALRCFLMTRAYPGGSDET